MYTEDDEKVEVKKKNSNNDYNDFYTAFNDIEKKEEKKEKKKSKTEEKPVKEEEDYRDFYGSSEEVEEPTKNNSNKTVIKIGVVVLLLVILAVLLVFLLKKDKEEPGDIELNKASYTLNIGDKDYISYKIVNTESDVIPKFTSSNTNVVTVDENGEITAISKGEATITISYTINKTTKEKQCDIVVDGPEIKHEISLNLKASATNWTNKDVTVTVDAKSDTKITYLKYAINCNGDCHYSDVVNNKITVTNVGTTKVTVVAKDESNLDITKEIITKIDKEAPSVTYNGEKNITSNTEVNVCVTCSDSLSGCKQEKVCKKFTSSKSNQVITVYDNAGNSKNSPTFNVTINVIKPACSLKVSSDGTVSATLNESVIYYSFDQSFSSGNELSRKFTISASKKGESGAKLVNYYVKNKNGTVGSCHITIIKECSADNVCSFRAI